MKEELLKDKRILNSLLANRLGFLLECCTTNHSWATFGCLPDECHSLCHCPTNSIWESDDLSAAPSSFTPEIFFSDPVDSRRTGKCGLDINQSHFPLIDYAVCTQSQPIHLEDRLTSHRYRVLGSGYGYTCPADRFRHLKKTHREGWGRAMETLAV